MPIFGGPPGLTFAFEREVETVPGVGVLVLGDAKILSSLQSDLSILQLERQREAASWQTVETPAADEIDSPQLDAQGGFFLSIEAGNWRLVNTNGAARDTYLSVINVG